MKLTPMERAAQLWTLPQFSKREMDADFAVAIANAISEAVDERRDRDAEIVQEYFREGRIGKEIVAKFREA